MLFRSTVGVRHGSAAVKRHSAAIHDLGNLTIWAIDSTGKEFADGMELIVLLNNQVGRLEISAFDPLRLSLAT